MSALEPRNRKPELEFTPEEPRNSKSKLKFTPEDDTLLIDLKEKKNLTWKQIADFFPGRSSGTLQVRYCTKLKAKTTNWTDEMVQKLRTAMDDYEIDRWRIIAMKVGNGFSPQACREKAINIQQEQTKAEEEDQEQGEYSQSQLGPGPKKRHERRSRSKQRSPLGRVRHQERSRSRERSDASVEDVINSKKSSKPSFGRFRERSRSRTRQRSYSRNRNRSPHRSHSQSRARSISATAERNERGSLLREQRRESWREELDAIQKSSNSFSEFLDALSSSMLDLMNWYASPSPWPMDTCEQCCALFEKCDGQDPCGACERNSRKCVQNIKSAKEHAATTIPPKSVSTTPSFDTWSNQEEWGASDESDFNPWRLSYNPYLKQWNIRTSEVEPVSLSTQSISKQTNIFNPVQKVASTMDRTSTMDESSTIDETSTMDETHSYDSEPTIIYKSNSPEQQPYRLRNHSRTHSTHTSHSVAHRREKYEYPPDSPKQYINRWAVALSNYVSTNHQELPLVADETIWAEYRERDGWIMAETRENGKRGLVPEELIRLTDDAEHAHNASNPVGFVAESPWEKSSTDPSNYSSFWNPGLQMESKPLVLDDSLDEAGLSAENDLRSAPKGTQESQPRAPAQELSSKLGETKDSTARSSGDVLQSLDEQTEDGKRQGLDVKNTQAPFRHIGAGHEKPFRKPPEAPLSPTSTELSRTSSIEAWKEFFRESFKRNASSQVSYIDLVREAPSRDPEAYAGEGRGNDETDDPPKTAAEEIGRKENDVRGIHQAQSSPEESARDRSEGISRAKFSHQATEQQSLRASARILIGTTPDENYAKDGFNQMKLIQHQKRRNSIDSTDSGYVVDSEERVFKDEDDSDEEYKRVPQARAKVPSADQLRARKPTLTELAEQQALRIKEEHTFRAVEEYMRQTRADNPAPWSPPKSPPIGYPEFGEHATVTTQEFLRHADAHSDSGYSSLSAATLSTGGSVRSSKGRPKPISHEPVIEEESSENEELSSDEQATRGVSGVEIVTTDISSGQEVPTMHQAQFQSRRDVSVPGSNYTFMSLEDRLRLMGVTDEPERRKNEEEARTHVSVVPEGSDEAGERPQVHPWSPMYPSPQIHREPRKLQAIGLDSSKPTLVKNLPNRSTSADAVPASPQEDGIHANNLVSETTKNEGTDMTEEMDFVKGDPMRDLPPISIGRDSRILTQPESPHEEAESDEGSLDRDEIRESALEPDRKDHNVGSEYILFDTIDPQISRSENTEPTPESKPPLSTESTPQSDMQTSNKHEDGETSRTEDLQDPGRFGQGRDEYKPFKEWRPRKRKNIKSLALPPSVTIPKSLATEHDLPMKKSDEAKLLFRERKRKTIQQMENELLALEEAQLHSQTDSAQFRLQISELQAELQRARVQAAQASDRPDNSLSSEIKLAARRKDQQRSDFSAESTREDTLMERNLRELIGDILGIHISRKDNIFALGIDSISLITLSVSARKRNVQLSVDDIVSHPSIEEMAKVADQNSERQARNESPVENDVTKRSGPDEEEIDSSPSSEQEMVDQVEPHLFSTHEDLNINNWEDLRDQLPEEWQWDVEYQQIHSDTGIPRGSWTCTPMEPDEPKTLPLTIGGAPFVIPVEYQWPPNGGAVNPPPDPRPSSPIDCTAQLELDVIRDIFLTFEGSVGMYLLVNGLLQLLVPEDFDTTWASSHLPHKYGGLKVCYITQSMEPTMIPTKTETKSKGSQGGRSSTISSVFSQLTGRPTHNNLSQPLRLNDFIEARTRSALKKEKFAGRIGLKVLKNGEPRLLMSSHVITEAILGKPHRPIFRKEPYEILEGDWNEQVEIWAGNEKIGTIDKTFDPEAELYPEGFVHDLTVIQPLPSTISALSSITSPLPDLGWLSRETWNTLRRQSTPLKILGDTETDRRSKTLKCAIPSEILIVGEGIFLRQSLPPTKPSRAQPREVWEQFISRALLYRVCPDFDPPDGYSGIALYAEGMRQDGTQGPGIAGFQSFVQRSGPVPASFDMPDVPLANRMKKGRVSFYGAFVVPEEVRKEYTIV